MADGEDSVVPGSPPLPKRGAYNIDFDSLDESSNPFDSKVKLGSSPPINSSSSYNFDPNAFDDVDPFKTKTAIPNSPVGSPKLESFANNNNNDSVLADSKSPGQLLENQEASMKSVTDVDSKPKASPKKKKVVKKSKVQSKMKLPRNFKPPETTGDEVQIFMPGETGSGVTDGGDALQSHVETEHGTDDWPPPPPPDELLAGDNEKKLRPSSLEEEVPYDPAPDAMVSSSEMDSHFVNKDDLDDLSQAFNTSNNPSSKNAQNKSEKTTLDAPSPTSTVIEEAVINEKVKSPASHEPAVPGQHPSDDGSPAVKKSPKGQGQDKSGAGKHPAARVLEANITDDNSLKTSADAKNESTFEDNSTFYDAPEYPPPSSSGPIFGQKSTSGGSSMQQTVDGGATQGTMVQLVQVLRYSQSDWNKLRQDLELGFQATLLTKEREWSALLGERDKRLEHSEESNKKLRQTSEDMRSVVAEFEKTISQLQAEKERHKKDLSKTTAELENERDQAVEDLQSVESAFSDLHRRYEKSKGIIEGFKKNEGQLKQHVEELQAKLIKSEAKLQSLRSQAEEKLDRANEDIEQIKRSTKSDVARLEAALKKAEIRICTLEESLQRKEKENQELTAICDELIAKVGS